MSSDISFFECGRLAGPVPFETAFVLQTYFTEKANEQSNMAVISGYVVMGFTRDEQGELVGVAEVEVESAEAAISQAKLLAMAKAGAIAFCRTMDPSLGEVQERLVLFRTGAVPMDLFDSYCDRKTPG